MDDKKDKKDDVKIEKADVLTEAIKEKEDLLQKQTAGIKAMQEKLAQAMAGQQQMVGALDALLKIQKAQNADLSEET